jgi:hypothetical protein
MESYYRYGHVILALVAFLLLASVKSCEDYPVWGAMIYEGRLEITPAVFFFSTRVRNCTVEQAVGEAS